VGISDVFGSLSILTSAATPDVIYMLAHIRGSFSE